VHPKQNRETGQQIAYGVENDSGRPNNPPGRSKGPVRKLLPKGMEERRGDEMHVFLIVCKRSMSTRPVNLTAPIPRQRVGDNAVEKAYSKKRGRPNAEEQHTDTPILKKTGSSMRVAADGTAVAAKVQPRTCPRHTQQPSSVRVGATMARQLHVRGGGGGAGWGSDRVRATRAGTEDGKVGVNVCMSMGGEKGKEKKWHAWKPAGPKRMGAGPKRMGAGHSARVEQRTQRRDVAPGLPRLKRHANVWTAARALWCGEHRHTSITCA